MNNDLKGADYRAVRRLSTGDDETLAEIGASCERVPEASLPWLLADGLIAPVTPPAVESVEQAWTDLGRPPDADEQVP